MSLQVQQLKSLLKIESDEVDRELENPTTEEIVNLAIDLDNNNYKFSDAGHIKYLWNNRILPYWNHRERPFGCRFLGNIDLDSKESDRLIEIVGENLQRLEYITDNSLQQNFSALDKDWIKIITFALSEYAYYDSVGRFWEGFCDRIGIKHSQSLENTLRRVTEQGIDSLGLIRASGGYKYVSTLWLQSGVPKQNLGHFATLVQDVANEYGWWEISHSSALDIAEKLWQYWESKGSQMGWGTIKHFLSLEDSNEDIEPIAGQLVKNIATIARELEYKSLSPETIKDREAREELIGNSNLSYSFFIRNWSDLITVLTPRTGKSDRSIFKRCNKPPYLILADTLNTLLILPEQSLWKKEWQNLRDTYCLIPEREWGGDIPSQGNLEIPELEIDIKKATNKWTCQLQNHYRNQIHKWEHEGINSEFPCLVFDAISGKHLQIDISNPKIVEIKEIILFTSREVEIELDNDIEVIDNCVPSSIEGWRGKQVRLIKSEALIQIQDIVISWRLSKEEQPQLIGLRLKGKKAIYINSPTLCYLPQVQELTINYLIESIDRKNIIAKDYLVIPTNGQIELSQWIAESGNYQATFWHKEKQWSYRFAVQQKYKITQHLGCRNLKIHDHHNNLLSTPTKYNDLTKFRGEEITINNLYPFEELIFRFKSDSEQYIFHSQADSSGKLTLLLTTLEHRLSKCDRYCLDFKQSGSEFKSILQIGYPVTDKSIATEVVVEESPSKDNLDIPQ